MTTYASTCNTIYNVHVHVHVHVQILLINTLVLGTGEAIPPVPDVNSSIRLAGNQPHLLCIPLLCSCPSHQPLGSCRLTSTN